jgi:type II secretory pathway component PulF
MRELAYPLFLLHAAAMVFPVGTLAALVWEGRVFSFLVQKAAILAPLYLSVLLVIFLSQGSHSESWRAWIERALGLVPMLGPARRKLALARLAAALEALLNAGVSILLAWDLAARASGSPALSRTVAGWQPLLAAGETPGEALSRSPAFPELFTNLYCAGEVSGQLDDTLRRLHAHYQEEGTGQLRRFARRTAHGVHLVILGAIAWFILSFWMGYLRGIEQVLEF